MTFPQVPIDVHTELWWDGGWHEVSADGTTATDSDVRGEDGIRIRRGRDDQDPVSPPSSCELTIDNRSGRYSRKDPAAALYGKLGKATPLRVRLGTSSTFFHLPGVDGSYVSTPDHASLDITGDIDVRIEITPDQGAISETQVLASKYQPDSDQRAWVVWLTADGNLEFGWSTDGTTAGSAISQSTRPVWSKTDRYAVRITLDVDNGAAQNEVRFYTSDSISGSWTQLGLTVVNSGTTSIVATTSDVAIGTRDDGVGDLLFNVSSRPFLGRMHAFELYAGLAGTLVAAPDFDSLTVADTGGAELTDSAGRVWTAYGSAQVFDESVRWSGEIANWPVNADQSGTDVTIPIQANGIRRRLSQGQTPLKSVLFRAFTDLSQVDAVAYWPCEEGRNATRFASPLPNVPPMRLYRTSGDVDADLAAYDGLAASESLPELNHAVASGQVPEQADTGELRMMCVFHVPSTGVPAADCTIMSMRCSGTAQDWFLDADTTGALRIRCNDNTGANILTSGYGAFGLNGVNKLGGIWLVQNGTDIDWQYFVFEEGATSGLIGSGTLTGGYEFGHAVSAAIGVEQDVGATAMGHVAIYNENTHSAVWSIAGDVLSAYTEEPAGRRLFRLAGEENIPIAMDGDPYDTVAMGPQTTDTVLDLLDACATADGGMLTDRRDAPALHYVTRTRLYGRSPTLTLDHAANELSQQLDPQDDDQYTRNDITVEREGGSSYRAVQTSGPLNISDPTTDPDGVGRYDDVVTLSLHADSQLAAQATWRRHLGTVDEVRVPGIAYNLATETHHDTAARQLDVGHRVDVTGTPARVTPDGLAQLVVGYEEYIANFEHHFVVTGRPESAWRIGHVDDPTLWRRTTASSHTGAWSYRAGPISHNEVSDHTIAVPDGAATLTFWYRVSSELNFDYLRVYVDGTQVLSTSGLGSWTASGNINVTGARVVTFRYQKDVSTSSGDDTAYIDDVQFDGVAAEEWRASPNALLFDSASSTVAAAFVAGTDTSLSVAVAGALWDTSGDTLPLTISAGGVHLEVTAITGATSPQTFTVEQTPVNGVTTTIPAGATVTLADPRYTGL